MCHATCNKWVIVVDKKLIEGLFKQVQPMCPNVNLNVNILATDYTKLYNCYPFFFSFMYHFFVSVMIFKFLGIYVLQKVLFTCPYWFGYFLISSTISILRIPPWKWYKSANVFAVVQWRVVHATLNCGRGRGRFAVFANVVDSKTRQKLTELKGKKPESRVNHGRKRPLAALN